MLIVVVPVAATKAARAGESMKNPFLGKTEKIAEGEDLYRRLCYVCHRHTGARGPNLRKKSRLDDEGFFNTVMNGRKGVMPAWRSRLSADDVWKIHAYVSAQR